MPSFSDSIILNVDDSEGARYAKTRLLQRAGYTVIEAATGAQALAVARAERPSLILLDTKLPDINGMEVCRQLKSDPETHSILVLQTSASYLGTGDKIRALDLGADNYLFEPIEPEELIANVRALLRLGNVERELREVDRRKDEFLATLAHELRNPLGPIRTALELLRHLDPDVAPMQEKARQTIARHTDHMVRLVDDLLDVSRISQGKIRLQLEPVELKTFLHSATETSSHLIASRGHRLSTELPDAELWVTGDQVRLSQIISNLLLNAAKFTAPGGAITLRAERQGDHVSIRISDNGIGIEAGRTDFIFGLFAQDGHSADRVQDGLGIGLSLVSKLVELHDGSVGVQSPGRGQGSTFEVRLPLLDSRAPAAAGQPPADAPVSSSAPSASTAPLRLLVVDDNQDAADILAELLRAYGHEVASAYSGEQALAVAAQLRPEAAFLDIGLPDIDGYALARRLRAMPGQQRMTLIALSGYGAPRDKDLAYSAGFDNYMVKPMDFDRLGELDLRAGAARPE